MPKTVNQCLLSQTDFDFMFISNSKIASSLAKELISTQEHLFFLVIFASFVALIGFSILFLAAVAIKRANPNGKALLIISMFLLIALPFIAYPLYTDLQEQEVRITGLIEDINAMPRPTSELLDSCNEDDAILVLAPIDILPPLSTSSSGGF